MHQAPFGCYSIALTYQTSRKTHFNRSAKISHNMTGICLQVYWTFETRVNLWKRFTWWRVQIKWRNNACLALQDFPRNCNVHVFFSTAFKNSKVLHWMDDCITIWSWEQLIWSTCISMHHDLFASSVMTRKYKLVLQYTFLIIIFFCWHSNDFIIM